MSDRPSLQDVLDQLTAEGHFVAEDHQIVAQPDETGGIGVHQAEADGIHHRVNKVHADKEKRW